MATVIEIADEVSNDTQDDTQASPEASPLQTSPTTIIIPADPFPIDADGIPILPPIDPDFDIEGHFAAFHASQIKLGRMHSDLEVPAEANTALDAALQISSDDDKWWSAFTRDLSPSWTADDEERLRLTRTLSAFEFGYTQVSDDQWDAASLEAVGESY